MTSNDRFIITEPGQVEVSQCLKCRHLSEPGGACKAFPDGIPYEIRANHHDHRQPYEGDQGVRWQARTQQGR